MALECLIGDRRTAQFKSWDKWMQAVDGLRDEWLNVLEDDPLGYNEVAAMSLLATAAVKINWLALAEFTTVKLGKSDRRTKASGRADLWAFDQQSEHSWSIEAKHGWITSASRGRLQTKRIEGAISDALCIRRGQARQKIALVVTLHDLASGEIELEDVTCVDKNRGGSREPDFCWRITHRGTKCDWAHDVYFSLYNVK